MARRSVVRIVPDAQIMRVIMRPGSATREQMLGRGKLAARYYHENVEKLHFQYENPDYPFSRHVDETSVRDAKVSVKVVGTVIEIEARAESAGFVEDGNGSRDIAGRPFLAIRTPDGRFWKLPKVGPMFSYSKKHGDGTESFHRPLYRAVKKAFRK